MKFPPLVLVPLLGWLWLAVACSAEWSSDSDYVHGWIVLPLAVYFLWKRISLTPPARSLPGRGWWLLVIAALLVLPLELGRLAPLYWRVFPWGIFLVVSLLTLVSLYLMGGRPWALACLFPLVFLASGIPWPTAFEQPLTLWLMEKISLFLASVLPLFGIPAQQSGTTLVLSNCTVGVEEACSGFRSLQSSIMLALAAGEVFSLRGRNRAGLLVIGIVLALVSNAGRTLALTWAGIQGGGEAMERVHDPAAWAALGFLAGGLFLFARWMQGQVPSDEKENLAIPRGGSWKRAGIVLGIGILGFVAAHGWYLWNESRVLSRAGAPVVTLNVDKGTQVVPTSKILKAGLGFDSGSYARLVLPDGMPVNGFHFFWDGTKNNAEQLYHRPDSCMPGGGWTFVGPAETVAGRIGRMDVQWTALPYERNGELGLLLWSAWVDGSQIPYSLHEKAGVQKNNLWTLIRNGRRTFSYETAAILIPYAGGAPPVERAVAAAELMFTTP